jgi:hypothetical protein
MKPIARLFSIVLLSVIIISCQREVKTDMPLSTPGAVINPTPVTGSLTGKVMDENNVAVAGATVKTGNSTTTTDSRGLFRFSNIQLDKYAALVTVEKSGYFKAFRTFSASANAVNFLKMKLVPKILAGTIDAAAGGSLGLPDNSRITLPASAVVIKSNNQPYSGNVKVYAAVIDPTSPDIAQTVPGSFQANDANNYRVLLKSYGMLAVELEGSGGEQLQIASGKTAKLRFAIPSSLRATAPSAIALWSIDETTGLWKEEGSAAKTGEYYEADVSHFSFWNCDISIPTIYLEMTIVTAEGPLPFTQVKITRINNGGSSHGYTDSAGHVGGLVPKNEPLLLEVMNTCNQPVYSQNIGPFSSNTNLGTITVTIPPLSSLQITGSAVACSNQPVTNGNALIYVDGILYNQPISNGNFSLTITRCNNSTVQVEVIAIDNAANQQSNAWTGTATTGTLNTGAITACGTSSVSYIDYTVDGSNFSLSTANAGDSITTYGANGTTQQATAVFGFRISQPNINISFYTLGAAVGTFPLQFLTVNQYDSVALVLPFNVTFTSYGAPGQFIEGNLSGQIRELANNALHTVTANFRVRRQ